MRKILKVEFLRINGKEAPGCLCLHELTSSKPILVCGGGCTYTCSEGAMSWSTVGGRGGHTGKQGKMNFWWNFISSLSVKGGNWSAERKRQEGQHGEAGKFRNKVLKFGESERFLTQSFGDGVDETFSLVLHCLLSLQRDGQEAVVLSVAHEHLHIWETKEIRPRRAHAIIRVTALGMAASQKRRSRISFAALPFQSELKLWVFVKMWNQRKNLK